jgi:trk system potassium uptake protein TrkA
MQVIVCGAGQVGLNIAQHLSAEGNEVTVIDRSPDLIAKINESPTMDVRAMVGNASYPEVLEKAGAADTEMVIAVTQVDEVNMVACQVAHSLFNVPRKVARVRAQQYLQPEWANLFSADHLPIDVRISPEIEVARAIRERLHVPGAFDTVSLADGLVRVIGTRLEEDCPILDTPLKQLRSLFPDLHLVVIAIVRDGNTIVPKEDDQMIVGDEVYFITRNDQMHRAMAAFGHDEPEAHRVIVVGGGNIGLFLAQEIEALDSEISLKLIEMDRDRARACAEALTHTIVLHGDVLDQDIQDELNIANSDMLITVTNDDEVNVLAALLAKRNGCTRTAALVNTMNYQPLVTTLGVDVAISPRAITVSTILQHLRRGRIRAVRTLREGVGEVVEAEALDTSKLVGIPLGELHLEQGVIIGAIARDGEIILPQIDTVLNPGDRVVMFATPETVGSVQKLLQVGWDFFA